MATVPARLPFLIPMLKLDAKVDSIDRLSLHRGCDRDRNLDHLSGFTGRLWHANPRQERASRLGNIFERLAQRSARGSKLTNREFLVKAMFFPARDHRGTSHDSAISFARIALSIAAAVTRNAHARQFRLGMRRAERRSVSVMDLRRLMQIPDGSFARRLDAFM